MNELELKYGCNPNQKPARIFMKDGGDLPIQVLNGKPGYINLLDAMNSWQLVREIREALGVCADSIPAESALGTHVHVQVTQNDAPIDVLTLLDEDEPE